MDVSATSSNFETAEYPACTSILIPTTREMMKHGLDGVRIVSGDIRVVETTNGLLVVRNYHGGFDSAAQLRPIRPHTNSECENYSGFDADSRRRDARLIFRFNRRPDSHGLFVPEICDGCELYFTELVSFGEIALVAEELPQLRLDFGRPLFHEPMAGVH